MPHGLSFRGTKAHTCRALLAILLLSPDLYTKVQISPDQIPPCLTLLLFSCS